MKNEIIVGEPQEGALLLLFKDNNKQKPEGWCKLIECSGEEVTYSNQEEIFGKVRWLIEWIDLKDYPDIQADQELQMSQNFLKGKKAHQVIHYYIRPERQAYLLARKRKVSNNPRNTIFDRFLKVNGKEIY